MAPVARFHSLTLLSAPAVSMCVPAGTRARPCRGVPAWMALVIPRVWTATVLSSLPVMAMVLLAWKATPRTGPAWGKNCTSLPVATSQARPSLSAEPVIIRDLSALNARLSTSAGCVSVATSLPSATVQTLTPLPAAAPTWRKSLLKATAVTGSASGPKVFSSLPPARSQSLAVLSAPPESACVPLPCMATPLTPPAWASIRLTTL